MRMDAGAVLGWKFNHTEGIKVIDSKIVEWPANLGEAPTQQQIDAWGLEYDAAMTAAKQAEDARIARRLADLLDALPTWAQHRADITAMIDAAQAATTVADGTPFETSSAWLGPEMAARRSR